MTGNGFDNLEGLCVQAEHTPTTKVETPASARRQARRQREFIMVPLPWADRLSKSTRRATIFVALHLLRLAWKTKGAPVALSNLGLAEWGVSRREKWRALAELEALELIVVERLNSKSPRVTLLKT